MGITACAKRGKTEEALDLFESMQAAGVKPNVISYNSLITACANGGKPEEALDLFESMQGAEVKPDVISYNSLITACAKGGKAEEALDLFESVQAAGVKADVISYNSLIDCLHLCEESLAETFFREARAIFFSDVWKNEHKLDLHGCSTGVAYFILKSLRAELVSGSRKAKDVIVITGHGLSRLKGAVLPLK